MSSEHRANVKALRQGMRRTVKLLQRLTKQIKIRDRKKA